MNYIQRTISALLAILLMFTCSALLISAEQSEQPALYTLTIPVPTDGSVEVERTYISSSYINGIDTYTFEEGAVVNLTFVAADGGLFILANLNGDYCPSVNNKYSFVIEEDCLLEAYFQGAVYYDIQLLLSFPGEAPDDDIIISIDDTVVSGGSASRPKDATPVLSVTTPEGFIAERVVVTLADSTKQTIYFDNNVANMPAITGNCTYEIIVIEGGDITVSIQAGAGGTATASKYHPMQGENVVFTFIPDEGYEVDKVTLNGTQISIIDNKYTARAVSNLTVVVTFKTKLTKKTVTISVDPESAFGTAEFKSNPTVSSLTVEHGANVVVVFTPDEGYQIDEILANGAAQNVTNNELVLSVTQDIELVVKFKVKRINITAVVTAAGGGDITAEGMQIISNMVTIDYGSSVTFVFTPHLGYIVSTVRVNNQIVNITGNKYTFNNVTQAQTISVTYKLEGSDTYYTVVATAGAGGKISPSGSQSVLQGQSIEFTITPDEGYEVLAVEVDGIDVSLSGGKYTINDIASDHTINAIFKQKGGSVGKTQINTGDIDWSGETVTIDLSETTVVAKAVFDKINTDCQTKTVIFTHGDFQIMLPLGGYLSTSAETVDLKITKNASANSSGIEASVRDISQTAVFSIIEINAIYPVDTQVKVFLGLAFANSRVDYYSYKDNVLQLCESGITVDNFGYVTTSFKQGEMVFLKDAEQSQNCTLTVKVGENGNVTPNGVSNVQSGATIDFEIYASEGYYISEIIINGEAAQLTDERLTAGTYSLKVTEDTEVEFKFMLLEKKSNVGLIIWIVILAIVLVGGSVLFYVKWNQAKY